MDIFQVQAPAATGCDQAIQRYRDSVCSRIKTKFLVISVRIAWVFGLVIYPHNKGHMGILSVENIER